MKIQSCLSLSILVGSLVSIFYPESINAQNIQPDNTLNTLVDAPNCLVCTITGGFTQGTNLFHSFEEFSIATGGEAFFNEAAIIEDIFARVTGNNLSEIDGIIRNNGANLMLLNPNGIVFRDNTFINVQGAFLATTANSLSFGSEGEFSVDTLQVPSLLTVTTPIGLGFGPEPGAIVSEPLFGFVQLTPDAVDNTLALIGGEITFLGITELILEDGNIELGSVSSNSFVQLTDIPQGWAFDYSQVQAFETIQVSDSFVSTQTFDTGQGGDIQVVAQDLVLDVFAAIATFPSDVDTGAAGNITIQASGAIQLSFESAIVSDASVGDGGDVTVIADNLQLENGSFIAAGTFGSGNAGDLIIDVSDEVKLIGTVFSNGDAPSGLFTQVEDDFVTGSGGELTLNARQLTLLDGAQISAAARGDGRSGNIVITATDSVLLSGTAPEATPLGGSSGIFTSTDPGSTQAGGNLTINTSQLTIENGAKISVDTLSEGLAGSATFNVNRLIVRDGGLLRSGSIQADGFPLPTGDGNTLTVTATESIEISGTGTIGTDFPVDSEIVAAAEGTGDAGQINLSTPRLIISDGGNVRTNSIQTSGGQITIQADVVQLLGDGDIVTAVDQGEGTGGNILIVGDSVVATGDSDILAFANEGTGGNITLPAFFGDGIQPNADITSLDDLNALDGNDRVDVNASGQLASGTITFPDVSFIENSLSELPENLIDTTALVASSCIAVAQSSGRLIITGADNIPQQPGSTGIATVPTGTIRNLPNEAAAADTENTWSIGDPIAEPQSFYQLPDGRVVLSRNCL